MATPLHKLKFYGDFPDGQKNKLCTYGVYDYAHAVKLLRKFQAKGVKIRKAYWNGVNVHSGQPMNVAITPRAYQND
jgi:hypothetical protein